MSVVAFDTLKFAQTLREKAKLTSEQAEGISQAFSDAVSEQIATKSDFINLATKQDIADTKKEIADTKKDVADIKKEVSDIKREILDIKTDISDIKKENLDTKKDIANILRLIADTNVKIVESKSEMLKWVIGLSMAQIAAIIAIFRLLPFGH